jgi:hypothetical protein
MRRIFFLALLVTLAAESTNARLLHGRKLKVTAVK